MADGVLNPAGLPTTRPLMVPTPESKDRLTDCSLMSTLVSFGPKVSTPALDGLVQEQAHRQHGENHHHHQCD